MSERNEASYVLSLFAAAVAWQVTAAPPAYLLGYVGTMPLSLVALPLASVGISFFADPAGSSGGLLLCALFPALGLAQSRILRRIRSGT